MNLKEYQEKARGTAIYPNLGNNLHYPVLGIVGEWGEFCSKVADGASKRLIKLELGDVLWYIANLACEIGISLEESKCRKVSLRRSLKKMPIIIGVLAETVKKIERDDAGLLSPKRKKIISKSLKDLLCCIDAISKKFGFSLEDVASVNLEKLSSRKKRNRLRGEGDER